MKILEEGKFTNPWSKQYTCSPQTCGAILMVDEVDVQAPDYQSSVYFVFCCPVCGAFNQIPANDICLRVKKKLNGTRKPASTYSR